MFVGNSPLTILSPVIFENMAAAIGAVPAAIVGSLCTMGVVATWMQWFQSLRDVDRLEDASTPQNPADT